MFKREVSEKVNRRCVRKHEEIVWWPSIIIVKYVSFWGEKNKKWKETKNISNQNRKKERKKIIF